jgi:EAL domain-containing protein (putative c-di-GMP-specific phosphodiesterase class I)
VPPTEPPYTLPATVLVVDDDALQRKVLSRRVSALPIPRVLEASSGTEALAVMEREPNVEVVISDLAMPFGDGLDLLCELGNRKSSASFVLHSAMDRQLLACMEMMARERRFKFSGILPKPASTADLLRLLARPVVPAAASRKALPQVPAEERRAALDAGQFVPFFQPKVRFSDRTVVGAEALARWEHPVHGFLPPFLFIDAFEAEGLLGKLTMAMLEGAIRAAREWADAGTPVPVSVNLSLSFLSAPGVAEKIDELTSKYRVPHAHVVLEITENVAMSDVGRCLENIARLKLRGHLLSIDDFGVGFSSLQQLVRIPFDEIKLDRSFVAGVQAGSRAALMLDATISMAKKLEMTSVAEGIETEEEWRFLAGLGCDVAQGYLIAKPMDAASFSQWLLDYSARNISSVSK